MGIVTPLVLRLVIVVALRLILYRELVDKIGLYKYKECMRGMVRKEKGSLMYLHKVGCEIES